MLGRLSRRRFCGRQQTRHHNPSQLPRVRGVGGCATRFMFNERQGQCEGLNTYQWGFWLRAAHVTILWPWTVHHSCRATGIAQQKPHISGASAAGRQLPCVPCHGAQHYCGYVRDSRHGERLQLPQAQLDGHLHAWTQSERATCFSTPRWQRRLSLNVCNEAG